MNAAAILFYFINFIVTALCAWAVSYFCNQAFDPLFAVFLASQALLQACIARWGDKS